MTKTHLYFAYGMNTNTDGMAQRCPDAVSHGAAKLVDHTFRFAQHADVVRAPGSYVDGVLWTITDQCLKSLDMLEGYPYYYNRRERSVWFGGRYLQAIVYYMQPGHVDSDPSDRYVNMVLQGYREHDVPAEQIYNALDALY